MINSDFNRDSIFHRALVRVIAITVLFFVYGERSSAAEFVVSNTDNSGAGSLRQAILDANSAAGDDDITFDSQVFGSPQEIVVQEEIIITDSLRVVGPGKSLLTIVAGSGGNPQYMFFIYGANVLATFESLTTATQQNVQRRHFLSFNRADLFFGDVDMISNGLEHLAASGGAVVVLDGNLTMQDCLVQGFVTEHRGGAVFVQNAQRQNILIERCAFRNNMVAGTDEANYPKDGGAIFVQDGASMGPSTKIEILDSEFSGNEAEYGGAIGLLDLVNLTLSNSTISQNTAREFGGAIYARKRSGAIFEPAMYIEASTITGNTARQVGGIWIDGSANRALFVANSIVAGNTTTASNTVKDVLITGEVTAAHSLFGAAAGDSDGLVIVEHQSAIGSVLTDTNPMLSALRDNGGPTQTHALQSGSPLIDAGSSNASPRDNQVPFPSLDQRGTGFSRVKGTSVDIGAFEFTPGGGGGTGGGTGGGGGSLGFLMILLLGACQLGRLLQQPVCCHSSSSTYASIGRWAHPVK